MTLGEFGWLVWLAGLPFAPWLLPRGPQGLDPWHAQAMWFHAGLGLACVINLHRGGRAIQNRPLAAWTAWIIGMGVYKWTKTIALTHSYPLILLMGLLHCLTLTFFFTQFTAFWKPERLGKLFHALAWMGAILVAYGLIQTLNLDQFFENLEKIPGTQKALPDMVVGMSGNPNHFGAHLAMLLSLMVIRQRWAWKGVAIALTFLILMTKSIGAYLALIGACLWLTAAMAPKVALGLSTAAPVAILAGCHWRPDFFTLSGRWEAWQAFWPFVQLKAITGSGPGFIRELSTHIQPGSPIFQWRHVHNELYQVLIEQGLIGLILMGWLLAATLRRAWMVRHHPVGMAAGASLIAMGLNSLVNWPAHLAMTASLGLVMASTIWLLSEDYRADLR